MGNICPKIDFVGGSRLSPNGFESERRYHISNAATIEEAEDCLCRAAPQLFEARTVYTDPTVDPDNPPANAEISCQIPAKFLATLQVDADERQRKGHWTGRAIYEDICSDVDFDLQYSSTGGSRKIIRSKETTFMTPNACNYQRLIGVRHGGEIDGCDINWHQIRLTINFCTEAGFVNCERFHRLACEPCVNDQVWSPEFGNGDPDDPDTFCFPAGSVLYNGIVGQSTRFGSDRLSLEFIIEKERQEEVVIVEADGSASPQMITIPPHHKLWARGELQVETVCVDVVTLPSAAYVERVYDPCDFEDTASGLGFADFRLAASADGVDGP